MKERIFVFVFYRHGDLLLRIFKENKKRNPVKCRRKKRGMGERYGRRKQPGTQTTSYS